MRGEFADSDAQRGDEAVARAAAQWLARRDRGLTAYEAEQLRRWCAADARHAEELDRLEKAWRDFDDVKGVPELVKIARSLDHATAVRPLVRTLSWRQAMMAAAAVALLTGGLWRRTAAPELPTDVAAHADYEVLASGAKRVIFDDSSVADVRGDGELRVEFTPAVRRVWLERGEALFTVAKDSARPFIVNVAGIEVRALGTAFNVRMAADDVDVLVTEGKVEVERTSPASTTVPDEVKPSVLVAGQRALVERYAAAEGAPIVVRSVEPGEIEETLAWQSARLVFNRTPLSDAIEAFNLHATRNVHGRFVLGDPALAAKRMGGTFRASNVEGFIRLLEQTAEVRVERHGREITLLPAR